MALTRVQKKGRIFGLSPVDDSRVIDQFMDDVIQYISCLTTDLEGGGSGSGGIKLLINRRISSNLTIVNETVCLQRNPIIEDGVTITVEDGGEFFIL